MLASSAAEVAALRSAAAVRERCERVHRWVREGRSPHFTLDENRLTDVAAYVAAVTREDYPDLAIPYHSRWRHFAVGNVDRWARLAPDISDPVEQARAAIDLVTVSVLLDAGAGDAWRYREPSSGAVYARSEGLAVASLEMFRAGGFSSDPTKPLRVDAMALRGMDTATLARYFQVDEGNPLIGLDGRAALLGRLGDAVEVRPGKLLDAAMRGASDGRVRAANVLKLVLDKFSSIWPSGLTVNSFALGDAGRHPAARTSDPTDQIVPFHKLSQWLTYSLLEPLQWAGLTVAGIDELTALPEYRNGGLLIDLGVIRPRQPFDPASPCAVSSELVVEWRALTVTLMDRLLPVVRRQLGLGSEFQLPHMLQGGTWSAGRKIARELRPPAGPSPLPILADGTVF